MGFSLLAAGWRISNHIPGLVDCLVSCCLLCAFVNFVRRGRAGFCWFCGSVGACPLQPWAWIMSSPVDCPLQPLCRSFVIAGFSPHAHLRGMVWETSFVVQLMFQSSCLVQFFLAFCGRFCWILVL
ncbi:hypothetical protein U1Q18_014640 [Sarracenia purpurea var. burkii]